MATLNVTLDSEGFEANLNGMIMTADKAATHVESRFRKVSVSLQQQIKTLNKNIDLNFIINQNGVSPIAKLQKEIEGLAKSAAATVEKLSNININFKNGSLKNTANSVLGGNSDQIASQIDKTLDESIRKASSKSPRKVIAKVEREVIIKDKIITDPSKPVIYNNNQSQPRIKLESSQNAIYQQIIGSIDDERSKSLIANKIAKSKSEQTAIHASLRKFATEKTQALQVFLKTLNIESAINPNTILNMLKNKINIPLEELLTVTSNDKSKQAIEKYIQTAINNKKKLVEEANQKLKFINSIKIASAAFEQGKAAYNAKKIQIQQAPEDQKAVLTKELTQSANSLYRTFSSSLKGITVNGEKIQGIIPLTIFKDMLRSGADISIKGIVDNAMQNNSGNAMHDYIRSLVPKVIIPNKPKIKEKKQYDAFSEINKLSRQDIALNNTIDILESKSIKDKTPYKVELADKIVNRHQENLNKGRHILAEQLKTIGVISNNEDLTQSLFEKMVRSKVSFSEKDFDKIPKNTSLNEHIKNLINKKQLEAQLVADNLSKKPIVVEQKIEVKTKIKQEKTHIDSIEELNKTRNIQASRTIAMSKQAFESGLSGNLTEEGLGKSRFDIFEEGRKELHERTERTRAYINDTIKKSGITGIIDEAVFREIVKKGNNLSKNAIKAGIEETESKTLEEYLSKIVSVKKIEKVSDKKIPEKKISYHETEDPVAAYLAERDNNAGKLFSKSMKWIKGHHEDYMTGLEDIIVKARGKGFRANEISVKGIGSELMSEVDSLEDFLQLKMARTHEVLNRTLKSVGVQEELSQNTIRQILDTGTKFTLNDIKSKTVTDTMDSHVSKLITSKRKKMLEDELPVSEGFTKDSYKAFDSEMNRMNALQKGYRVVESRMHEEAGGAENMLPQNALKLDKFKELVYKRAEESTQAVNHILKQAGFNGFVQKATMRELFDTGKKLTLGEFASYNPAENINESSEKYFKKLIDTKQKQQQQDLDEAIGRSKIDTNSDAFKRRSNNFNKTLNDVFTKEKDFSTLSEKLTPDKIGALDSSVVLGGAKKRLDTLKNQSVTYLATAIKEAGIEGMVEHEVLHALLSSGKKVTLEEIAGNKLSPSRLNDHIRSLIGNTIAEQEKIITPKHIAPTIVEDQVKEYERLIKDIQMADGRFLSERKRMSKEAVTKDKLSGHLTKEGLGEARFTRYEELNKSVTETKQQGLIALNKFIADAGITGVVSDEVFNAMIKSYKGASLKKIAKHDPVTTDLNSHIQQVLSENIKIVTPETFKSYQKLFNKNMFNASQAMEELETTNRNIKLDSGKTSKNRMPTEDLENLKSRKKELIEQIENHRKEAERILHSVWGTVAENQNGGKIGGFNKQIFNKMVKSDQFFDLEELATYNQNRSFTPFIKNLLDKKPKLPKNEIIETITGPAQEYNSILKDAQAKYKEYIKLATGSISLTDRAATDEIKKSLENSRKRLNDIAIKEGSKNKIGQRVFEKILVNDFSLDLHKLPSKSYNDFNDQIDSMFTMGKHENVVPMHNRKVSGAFGNTPISISNDMKQADEFLKLNEKLSIAKKSSTQNKLVFDIFGLSALNNLPWGVVTNKIKTFTTAILDHFKTQSVLNNTQQPIVQSFKNIPIKQLQSRSQPEIEIIKENINVGATDVHELYHKPLSDPNRIDKTEYAKYQNILLMSDQYVDKLHEINEFKLKPFSDDINDYKDRHAQLSNIKKELQGLHTNMLAEQHNGVSISENIFGKDHGDIYITHAIDEVSAHMKSLELATGMAGKEFEYLTFKKLSWTATDDEKEKLNILTNSMKKKDADKLREQLTKDEDISAAITHNRKIARYNKEIELEKHIGSLKTLRSQAEQASGGPIGSLYNKLTQLINEGSKITSKMQGESKNDPKNYGNQIDAMNVFINKVKEAHSVQDSLLEATHKKQLQHQSQLAQWFETFGMTMSGIAATVFVGQYIFMAFKALSDLKTVLQDKIESFGGLTSRGEGNYGTEQQEGVEKVLRAVSANSSLGIDQSVAYVKKKLEQGFDLSNTLKDLVSKKMEKESDTIANKIHALTNMLKELSLSVFDSISDDSMSAIKSMTEYLRKNKEGVVEIILGIVKGAKTIIFAFEPPLKILGALVLTLAKIGEKISWLSTAMVGFAVTLAISSKIPFFVTLEAMLTRQVVKFSAAGVMCGNSFATGLLAGFAKKSFITAGIVLLTMGLSKVADLLIGKYTTPSDSIDDMKNQIDKKKKELDTLKKDQKEMLSEQPSFNNPILQFDTQSHEKMKKTIESKQKEISELQEKVTPKNAKAIMVGWVDADTQIVLINGQFERIRQAYIDAEESVSNKKENTQQGKIASLFVRNFIAPGDEVIITDYFDGMGTILRDHYGRLLGQMQVDAKSKLTLQKILIESGLATYRGDYKDKYGKEQENPELAKLKPIPAMIEAYNRIIKKDMNETAKALHIDLSGNKQDSGLAEYFQSTYVKHLKAVDIIIHDFEEKWKDGIRMPTFSNADKKKLDLDLVDYQIALEKANIYGRKEENLASIAIADKTAEYSMRLKEGINKYELLFSHRRSLDKDDNQAAQRYKNEQESYAKNYADYATSVERINKESHVKQLELLRQTEDAKIQMYDRTTQKFMDNEFKKYSIQLKYGSNYRDIEDSIDVRAKEQLEKKQLAASDDLSLQRMKTDIEYSSIFEKKMKENWIPSIKPEVEHINESGMKVIENPNAGKFRGMLEEFQGIAKKSNFSNGDSIDFPEEYWKGVSKKLKENFGLESKPIEDIELTFRLYFANLIKDEKDFSLKIEGFLDDFKGTMDKKIEMKISDQASKFQKYESVLQKGMDSINSLLYGKHAAKEESISRAIESFKGIDVEDTSFPELLKALGKTREEYDKLTNDVESSKPLLLIQQQFEDMSDSMKNVANNNINSFSKQIDAMEEFINYWTIIANLPMQNPIVTELININLDPIKSDYGTKLNKGYKEGQSGVKELYNDLKSDNNLESIQELENLSKASGKSYADFEIELSREEYKSKQDKLIKYTNSKKKMLKETYDEEKEQKLLLHALEITQLQKEKIIKLKNEADSGDLSTSLRASFLLWADDVKSFHKSVGEELTQLSNDISSNIGSNVKSILKGNFDEIGQSWNDLMENMLESFTKMYMEIAMKNMAKAMMGDGISSGSSSNAVSSASNSASSGLWSTIGNFLGSLFSSSSAGGAAGSAAGALVSYGRHHGGGVIGIDSPFSTGMQPSYLWDSAPRLHSGLMPDEYRAVLQKNESVLTPAQMKAVGNNSNVPSKASTPEVKLIVNNNMGNQPEVSHKTSFNGQAVVVEMFLDAMNRDVGGLRSSMGQR